MRGNVKATIAIILLLGVIATAIIAVISDGFTLPVEEWGAKFDIKDNMDEGQVDDDKTPGTDNEDQDTPDDVDPETPGTGGSTPSVSGGGVTDENGNYLDQDGVSPMPQAMAFSVDETDGNGSVTIIASIEPSDATNNDIAWDVQFVDPDSEWATGKTVTDYVTILPDSAGYSGVCTVTCHQAFGEQIIVTAQSVANPDVKQSCTVDYKQRLLDIYMEINGEKFEAEKDFPLYDHTGIDYLISANTNVSVELNENYPGEEFVFDFIYETNEIYTRALDIAIEYENDRSVLLGLGGAVFDLLSEKNLGRPINFDMTMFWDQDLVRVYDKNILQGSGSRDRCATTSEIKSHVERIGHDGLYEYFSSLRYGVPSFTLQYEDIVIECELTLHMNMYVSANLKYLEGGDAVAVIGVEDQSYGRDTTIATIPETVNGKPVTVVREINFFAGKNVDGILNIPASVIAMNENAFYAHDEHVLKSLTINYGGTTAQWQENLPSGFYIGTNIKLDVDGFWEVIERPITVNCNDGTIKLKNLGSTSVEKAYTLESKVFSFSYYDYNNEANKPEGFYITGLTDYGKTLSSIEVAYSSDGIPITGIDTLALEGGAAIEIKLINPELHIGNGVISQDSIVESLTISNPDYDLRDYYNDSLLGKISENLKEVILTESITYIDSSMLSVFKAHVESIFILGNISEIDSIAFDDIDDNLKNIYYSGTEEEWTALRVDVPSGCTVHYNYDPNEEAA